MSNLDFAFWDAVSFADTGRHPADVFEQHIALAQERTAEYEEIVAYHLEQAHNHQVALGAASLDDCALTVLATVVSKPAAGRIILDCGSKTLTNDQARGITPAAGYGAVLTADGTAEDDGLTIERLSEEHATVRVQGATRLEPGDRVRVVPNHSCVVSNLVDVVRLVDDDRVVDSLPVAARGKIQ